jgi:hypothetical protein
VLDERRRVSPPMPLYAVTIFLSAFLLFVAQPLVARQILPWYGGSAAVWATCLVFFQSVLLLGYAYSDFVIRRLAPSRQFMVHAAMLAISLAWLPIAPDAQSKPAGSGNPALPILGLLAATIGLPYLMLSTTSPLVQAWYWQRHGARAPYRLFALSNSASLLALLAYPVAIEPWISTPGQSWGWSALYGTFVVLCACTGYASVRNKRYGAIGPIGDAEPVRRFAEGADGGPAAAPSVTGAQCLAWLLPSAIGSCLLLAVTNHITQNVAAVPFLWLLPLALYLITFIIAFDRPRWYARRLVLAALAILLPAMAWCMDQMELEIVMPLYAAGLFVGCLFCHGELERAKPEPRHLTTFYLMVSAGGVIGSVLVGIIAPMTLRGYYELGIVLVMVGVLAVARVWPHGVLLRLGAAAVTAGTAVLVWIWIDRFGEDMRVMERNFYAALRTRDFGGSAPFRAMYHGSILHGGQRTESGARRTASTYFGPRSGYGRLFASLPDHPRRIGVIGLGAGALAAYCRPQDTMVFYEINPQVVQIARREFTFLADAPGTIEIVLGDGRMSLEGEPPRGYHILAIDAFSGDSIPMHLVTRESMRTYLKHLDPAGAIVFQATNRFIDIAPVVQRLAQDASMSAVLIADLRADGASRDAWDCPTEQIIVTRNRDLLQAQPIRESGRPIESEPGFPVFTDDYSNLLRILK